MKKITLLFAVAVFSFSANAIVTMNMVELLTGSSRTTDEVKVDQVSLSNNNGTYSVLLRAFTNTPLRICVLKGLSSDEAYSLFKELKTAQTVRKNTTLVCKGSFDPTRRTMSATRYSLRNY